MNTWDLDHLRRAIAIASQSRHRGNNPFGTVLADDKGAILLEAENTTVSTKDCTAHSDINVIRAAWQQFNPDLLAKCTIYTSAEPCAMCAGATVWSNIRRVVFGLGQEVLYELMSQRVDRRASHTLCRDVFNGAPWKIEVTGPLLEEEAARVHQEFWHKDAGKNS